MKYVLDNDLHIHSELSLCSNHPEQTADNLLKYAENANLKSLCVTDHYWDETVPGASDWYKIQNTEHINAILPLPKSDKVDFRFGCETEMDKNGVIGLAPEHADRFAFIVVPINHFHMESFTIPVGESSPEARAKALVKHFEYLLNSKLPLSKVGVAHLNCDLMAKPYSDEGIAAIFDSIPFSDWDALFKEAKKKGLGIELNLAGFTYRGERIDDSIFRPFMIARDNGCKFYFASDSHTPEDRIPEVYHAKANRVINKLGLTEDLKYKMI